MTGRLGELLAVRASVPLGQGFVFGCLCVSLQSDVGSAAPSLPPAVRVLCFRWAEDLRLAEAERFDVPLYLHPPAAPQQAEPVAWAVFDPSGEAIYAALFKTRCVEYVDNEYRYGHGAAKHWAVRPAFAHPPADEVQQAEPVAQIGWADEFGNIFPMGAWKPAQRTHHDSHKAAWRPVFLHPPAAEVQRLRDALKPFAAIDLTTNQAVNAMDVLRARRALEGLDKS